MLSDLNGNWSFEIEFLWGAARHSATLTQDGEALSGTYRSQYGVQEISGTVDGQRIRLRTGVRHQACGAGYGFAGSVSGNHMEGDLALGEYWTARWQARRVGTAPSAEAC